MQSKKNYYIVVASTKKNKVYAKESHLGVLSIVSLSNKATPKNQKDAFYLKKRMKEKYPKFKWLVIQRRIK